MVLPLFKSHYSLGRSILTLEKKETQLINGPDSIIDICLDHEIKDFYLVEDSMGSFLQAYSNTKDEDLSFYIYEISLNNRPSDNLTNAYIDKVFDFRNSRDIIG